MEDINVIIDNLQKWKKICKTMESQRDLVIVDEIINIVKESKRKNKIKTSEIKEPKKRERDLDRLKEALEYYNDRDSNRLNNFKFSIVKIDSYILEEWKKMSKNKQEKLSKLELNVIYNILYKLEEVKFLKKKKDDIIFDINYVIQNLERSKALKEKTLFKI